MSCAPGERRFRLRVFGRFELSDGGRIVIDDTWPRRRAAAILKLLALQPDGSLHRDLVCDALWPELDGDAAANNLRKNLYRLRRQLNRAGVDATIVVQHGRLLALSPDVLTDALAFGCAARCALEADTAALYDDALALYAADVLEADMHEPWAEQPRREARALRDRLLWSAAQAHERDGARARALACLAALLASDPLREDAHRAVMRIHAAAGDSAAALRQYEDCRRTLRAGLDTDPSGETEALARDIQSMPATPAVVPAPPMPEVHHATTEDGVRIAFAVTGRGPTLVEVASTPWSHLHKRWEWGFTRRMIERPARFHRLVFYDGRGSGVSQRDVLNFTLEGHISDLKAVIDEVGAAPVMLLGQSLAGPTAIAFAARYPQVVSHLVLVSTWYSGADYWHDGSLANSMSLLAPHWREFTEAMALNLTGWKASDLSHAYAEYLRACVQPDTLERINSERRSFDVSALLPHVRAKTLVIHAAASNTASPAVAARMARDIPGATLAQAVPSREIPRLIDNFLLSNACDSDRAARVAARERPLGASRPLR